MATNAYEYFTSITLRTKKWRNAAKASRHRFGCFTPARAPVAAAGPRDPTAPVFPPAIGWWRRGSDWAPCPQHSRSAGGRASERRQARARLVERVQLAQRLEVGIFVEHLQIAPAGVDGAADPRSGFVEAGRGAQG